MNDLRKYLREPYLNYNGQFQEDIIDYPSPDGKKSIVITHCWEHRMGSSACLFHLIDENEKIIEDFTPHTTSGNMKWKDDSNTVAIQIGVNERAILIMNLESRKFALIKTNCSNFEFETKFLRLYIPQKDIDNINSGKVVGGGESELPRVKYEKPEDIKIDITTLNYYEKNDLPNIFQLNKDEKENCLRPIENGFWDFNGRLPISTYDMFNNRDLEVYQLQAFAKYGDEQSIKWIEEIKSKKDMEYDLSRRVSDYLGYRTRN